MDPARIALPLSTDRLLLRDFTADDHAAVHAYAARDEVVRFMTWGPNTPAQTTGFLEQAMAKARAEPRQAWELGVCERQGGRLVGGAGLEITNATFAAGFLGYCFHPEVWGRGYATEASRALLEAGFGVLGLHRIWTTCDVDNGASARVLEKIGMRREGTLRHHLRVRGTWRDHHLYAVLSSDPPRA